jgi:hypothetical protein
LFEFHDVDPIVVIGDDLMPCSKRPDPDRDPNIVEIGFECSKEATK